MKKIPAILALLVNLLLLTPYTYGMTNQQRLDDQLTQAIEADDPKLVKQAIKDGANVNAPQSISRVVLNQNPIIITRSPLHAAIWDQGNVQIAKLLLDEGANVNARDSFNKTPLHYAALYGNFDMAKFLITQGADVNAADVDENTPLHDARTGEIARALIKAGANKDAQNDRGDTPLHFAVTREDISTIQTLLSYGANRVLANDEGKTPLQDALTFGNREVIEILEPKPKKPGRTNILTPKQIIKNNK